MMQLITLFQAQNWHITFASPSKLGEHRTDLLTLGVNEQSIELNNTSFDHFILQLQPQVVIFDRFMMEEQFGWRVEKHAPNATRVLNTEDLHSLRTVRQTIVKDYLKTAPNNIDLTDMPLHDAQHLLTNMAQTDLAKREVAAIFRCDLTLMISEFEMDLLQNQFQVPSQQLCYLPFLYSSELCQTHANHSYETRQHFIAIGNFRHEPNWDAVLWLKQDLWPKIRQQLPSTELHIYGAYPPKKATQLHNEKQGFHVLGWAEDAFEVIRQARVCLAPLRFGAGIKGKLAESMLCGTPSVTTSMGTESMRMPTEKNQFADWAGEEANNTEDFVQAAVHLYNHKDHWLKAQQTGFETVQSRYLTPQATQVDFIMQLDHIMKHLDKHKQHNFIGAMLNHHHHKSTQYMAQWIEAKNQ